MLIFNTVIFAIIVPIWKHVLLCIIVQLLLRYGNLYDIEFVFIVIVYPRIFSVEW